MQSYHIRWPGVELTPGTSAARWLEAAPVGVPLTDRQVVLQLAQQRLDRKRTRLGVPPYRWLAAS